MEIVSALKDPGLGRETGVIKLVRQTNPRALLTKHFGLGGAFELEPFP